MHRIQLAFYTYDDTSNSNDERQVKSHIATYLLLHFAKPSVYVYYSVNYIY